MDAGRASSSGRKEIAERYRVEPAKNSHSAPLFSLRVLTSERGAGDPLRPRDMRTNAQAFASRGGKQECAGQTALHRAILAAQESGKAAGVCETAAVSPARRQMLLEESAAARGCDIDAVDCRSRTALHYAASLGDKIGAEVLLRHGADTGAPDENGDTPLHCAAEGGHAAVLNLMLEGGPPSGRFSPFEHEPRGVGAASGGLEERGEKDGEARAAPDESSSAVNARNSDGYMPLHVAVRHNNPAASEILLRRGANPNAAYDKRHRTPLHFAAMRAQAGTAELLLRYGANPDALGGRLCTPLHHAAEHRRGGQTVRILLKHTAFRDRADGADKAEGADRAGENGGKTSFCGAPTVDAADLLGRTPLHYAAESGDVDGLRALAEHGAKVDAVDCQGRTPLHCAAHQGNVNAIEVLLGQGAKIEARDFIRRTPLHCAASHSFCKTAYEALIAAGADIEAADKDGRTPLHLAAMALKEDTFRALVAKGASVGATDLHGRVPLHYCASGVCAFPRLAELIDELGLHPWLWGEKAADARGAPRCTSRFWPRRTGCRSPARRPPGAIRFRRMVRTAPTAATKKSKK